MVYLAVMGTCIIHKPTGLSGWTMPETALHASEMTSVSSDHSGAALKSALVGTPGKASAIFHII